MELLIIVFALVAIIDGASHADAPLFDLLLQLIGVSFILMILF